MPDSTKICSECKNQLDKSAFGWDSTGRTCNGCWNFKEKSTPFLQQELSLLREKFGYLQDAVMPATGISYHDKPIDPTKELEAFLAASHARLLDEIEKMVKECLVFPEPEAQGDDVEAVMEHNKPFEKVLSSLNELRDKKV